MRKGGDARTLNGARFIAREAIPHKVGGVAPIRRDLSTEMEGLALLCRRSAP